METTRTSARHRPRRTGFEGKAPNVAARNAGTGHPPRWEATRPAETARDGGTRALGIVVIVSFLALIGLYALLLAQR